MNTYQFTSDRKKPTKQTIEENRKLAKKLGIDERGSENEELLLSKAHCLRPLPKLELKDEAGNVIWKHDAYDFIDKEEIPESVNPSLWLNCRSLYECGVFSVVGKDIVQVRGFDIANITFVRTKTGWIVLDAGSTVEGSKAALEETELALGETIRGNIKAVIISHSHGDHFGGIAGIVSKEEVGPATEGKIPIYVAKGETANEIARELPFPDQLTKQWYLRPYYGTYENNIRAIYHKYLGYYDGNPIHLNPLTPIKEAEKFIQYVGSKEKVLEKALQDYEKGEYQYAAYAANAVVFADPENVEARYLCADALEQLGYQSESAIFRNAYLLGAKELRDTTNRKEQEGSRYSSVLQGMASEQLLDYLGMLFDGVLAWKIQGACYLTFSDEDNATYYVQSYAGTVLKHRLSEEEKKEKNEKVRLIEVTKQEFIAYLEGTLLESHPLLQETFWKELQGYLIDIDSYHQFHIVKP